MSPRVLGSIFLLAAGAMLAAGCDRDASMRIHYLPGIVAGSERVLPPEPIAVAPVAGPMAAGTFKVGAIYDEHGNVERELFLIDPGPLIAQAVVRCLSDAGLKPVMQTSDRDALRRNGVPVLTTVVEELSVEKRFRPERTVHGQYFSMTARARLSFTLSSRANSNLYSGVMTGTEEEPPAPVGGEIFLPLETEPAESLSVALSRAIGALVLDPRFRAALVR